MADLYSIFRKNLAARVKVWGAKKKLIEDAGLSPKSLFKYLDGSSMPGLDQVDRIAKALGCEPWELLIDQEKKPTRKLSEYAHKIVIDEIDKLRLK